MLDANNDYCDSVEDHDSDDRVNDNDGMDKL